MSGPDKVNILLVDDQPAKLLSYEVILQHLGENLLKASSPSQALSISSHNVAAVLMDVCMPGLDGFELAEMIREHPRCRETAIIFYLAVHPRTRTDCATRWAPWTTYRSPLSPKCCRRRSRCSRSFTARLASSSNSIRN